jgi:hypothetical protein
MLKITIILNPGKSDTIICDVCKKPATVAVINNNKICDSCLDASYKIIANIFSELATMLKTFKITEEDEHAQVCRLNN